MIPLLIVLLVLLVIALLPLGGRVRYDENGLSAALKVGPVSIRLFPPKKDKPPQEKKPKEDKPKQADGHPKRGGPLALVKGCLPLVKPALEGVRKRLSIDLLELRVVWAAADPADAAMGYGAANAALGIIWPLLWQNFKIRKHDVDIGVDFDAVEPTLYAQAQLTMTLFRLLTLALPLLVKFLRVYRAVNAAPEGETVKKEA